MCIYFGDEDGLTYQTQEHIIPAALGCCTKLDKGTVSDKANSYFSPIERNVIEHSFLLVPRIIIGPGKRGKLSPKYATTSKVSEIEHGGDKCLGYMKGNKAYLLSQFIVDKDNKIYFVYQKDGAINVNSEMDELMKCISAVKDKFVSVNMHTEKSGSVYITLFKDKVHVGYDGKIPPERINEVKALFANSIIAGDNRNVTAQVKLNLVVEENFVSICKVVAKTAINTLAYIMGEKYIRDSADFDKLIDMIFSDDEKILTRVFGVADALEMKRTMHLKEEQHACLLMSECNSIKAVVFFYERCFEVILCDGQLSNKFPYPLEGIVCDWKNRKDYKYLYYLTVF